MFEATACGEYLALAELTRIWGNARIIRLSANEWTRLHQESNLLYGMLSDHSAEMCCVEWSLERECKPTNMVYIVEIVDYNHMSHLMVTCFSSSGFARAEKVLFIYVYSAHLELF